MGILLGEVGKFEGLGRKIDAQLLGTKSNKSDLKVLYDGNAQNTETENKQINEKLIQIPMQIDVYLGQDITIKDKYRILIDKSAEFYVKMMSVMVIDNNRNECGFFVIQSVKEKDEILYYLTAKSSMLTFNDVNNSSFKLVFNYNNNVCEKDIKINIHEVQKTDAFLCIDFGTSNTTAGCWLNSDYISNLCNSAINNNNVKLEQENIVTFNTDENTNDFVSIIPTMVYVEDCSDKENIKYIFGYSAFNKLKEENYCPSASCFMEIKRWVTDCENTVKINDSNGNIAEVLKRDIIKECILYIIKEAEQQFKCKFCNVHISAPIKLKSKFLVVFKNILEECGYVLETENAIDEGIAVLYDIIDNEIKNLDNDINKKALVIDCGGGTSDLASCEYDISKDDDVVDLRIKTEYINGDFNFGGNNLTYRIMQYMKVVYAHYYTNEEAKNGKRLSIEDVIDMNIDKIISHIENNGQADTDEKTALRYKSVYEKLEQEYEKYEAVIPTKFRNYETEAGDIYERVKNNFYFMWNLADKMKKQFYQFNTISRYTICSEESDKDTDLYVNPVPNWRISVYKNGNLNYETYPDIMFNAKEISWLMQGDIYYLIHKFLNKLYNDGTLNKYNTIKLSGQSANIDIFKNSLKEFLPGKKIRINHSTNEKPENLKLICIKGAIKYLHSLHCSDMEVCLENETENIPVDVYVKSDNQNKLVINRSKGWTQKPEYKRITSNATEIEMYLSTPDEKDDKLCRFYCKDIEYCNIKVNEIEKLTNGLVNQEYLDVLKEGRTYAIIYVNKNDWGFNVLPLKISNEGEYLTGKVEFYSFETDVFQKTFFDGNC